MAAHGPRAKIVEGALKVVPLGGCAILLPLKAAAARGLVDVGVFRRVGFRRMPRALTAGALLQLVDFCTGDLDIPAEIQRYCYIDPVDAPSGNRAAAIRQGDMALIELTSPNEITFRGYSLNPNYLIWEVARLKARDPALAESLRRCLGAGLWRRNERVRAMEARNLADNLRVEDPRDEMLLAVTEEARGALLEEAEIERILRDVERRLDMPVALALHVARYMPDGRPVAWPLGFTETMRSLARRLGWPAFDPAPLVAARGVEQALVPEGPNDDLLMHYRPAFDAVMGEALHDFIRRVLRRQARRRRPSLGLEAPVPA